MQMKILMPMLAVASAAFSADGTKIRADLSISEIVSVQVNNDIYRAIKGFNEIYPFLVIEKIQLPLAEGDSAILSNSWEMSELVGAKTLLPLKEGDDIRDMKWREKKLEFNLYKEGLPRKCHVTNITEGKPSLSCEPGRKKK
jgi:hypothetical protein